MAPLLAVRALAWFSNGSRTATNGLGVRLHLSLNLYFYETNRRTAKNRPNFFYGAAMVMCALALVLALCFLFPRFFYKIRCSSVRHKIISQKPYQ